MESSSDAHFSSAFQSKEKLLFSKADPYSFVSASAYDTAWLAMIPDYSKPISQQPLFENCLKWVLNNQKEDGFWGDCNAHGNPTLESLTATLACLAALGKWKVGHTNIEKGFNFIWRNAEKFGVEMKNCPSWFVIVFPGVIELIDSLSIEFILPESLEETVKNIFILRGKFLSKEECVDMHHYPPLLSYLEALPERLAIDKDDIARHLSSDGSLFQSPAATACAYMITRKKECLDYLQLLVKRCPNGVPPTYPMDEVLLKISMINQVRMLGLAENFKEETEEMLAQVYRNYENHKTSAGETLDSFAKELYKDSLAFRLLRLHGYSISTQVFCWFLQREDILNYLEKNHQYLSALMLNIYRATDLMFNGEHELEVARSFSRTILQKSLDAGGIRSKSFHAMIEHELRVPWQARLDHLEHRIWIEYHENNALWNGKTCPHRLSGLYNDTLLQLAKWNYEYRQSVMKEELDELTRWSKSTGLSTMGFGREKTTYCYFAVATSTSLPSDSDIRLIVAKSAMLITIADDFFDTKGSLHEMERLTIAVQRWDSKGLDGHSETIFDALKGLVGDMAAKHLRQERLDITNDLRNIWYETFNSWLTEAKWSRNECIPSMDEYLKTGMISVATHTMTLPAACFLKPRLASFQLKPPQYQTITKLLMVSARLLNDINSYQRELKEGTTNSVLLYMKENHDADIEESVTFVKELLDIKKKEFLEYALKDGLTNMPKPFRDLHLSCFKVFHMFYNTSNRYDSDTEMLEDIAKAIYIPLDIPIPSKHNIIQLDAPVLKKMKPFEPQITASLSSGAKKINGKISSSCFARERKHVNIGRSAAPHGSCFIPGHTYKKNFMRLNLKFSFM